MEEEDGEDELSSGPEDDEQGEMLAGEALKMAR